MQPQRFGGAQTRAPGHLLDGQSGRLQQLPGPIDALVQQPLQRAGARLLAETAGAGAHMGVGGQVAQGRSLVEALQRPIPTIPVSNWPSVTPPTPSA